MHIKENAFKKEEWRQDKLKEFISGKENKKETDFMRELQSALVHQDRTKLYKLNKVRQNRNIVIDYQFDVMKKLFNRHSLNRKKMNEGYLEGINLINKSTPNQTKSYNNLNVNKSDEIPHKSAFAYETFSQKKGKSSFCLLKKLKIVQIDRPKYSHEQINSCYTTPIIPRIRLNQNSQQEIKTIKRLLNTTGFKKSKYACSFDDQQSKTFLKDILLSHYRTSTESSFKRNSHSEESLQNFKEDVYMHNSSKMIPMISKTNTFHDLSSSRDFIRNISNTKNTGSFLLKNEQGLKLSAFSTK